MEGNESRPSIDELSPTLPIYIFCPTPDLQIAYDAKTKNPVYVMERLADQPGKTKHGHKRPHFFEEKALPEDFRSRPSHYKHSGFDRGHLAAAANWTTKGKELEFHQTFNLCNVSPQNHKMNCSIWSKLEYWVRKVAQEEVDSDTYVVTGPLWLPSQRVGEKLFTYQYSAIGSPPSLVSVPTHLFKVVAVIPKSKSKGQHHYIQKFACFVVPNDEVDTKKEVVCLQDFLVPWSKLETVTGLVFFPGMTKDWKDQANLLTNNLLIESGRRQSPPLLLTDGSEASKKKWGRWNQNDLQLIHLCANGRCR